MKEEATTNLTMLCDFYELTMGNGYLKEGIGKKIAYFDVFFRNVPDGGGFAIAAGLEQVIDYINNLHFTEADLAYLRSRGMFDEAFLDYLRTFRFTGDIYAVPEGTPVFPHEPILTVRAPAIEAQFVETFLLLALTIFWCVSKEEGYYLLFVGFFGTVLNQFLKLLCRIPRPWVRDPSFTIVESARSGAGGYSFPSGHTQNAVGTLGGIARWHKNRALSIVCIVLAALTAFSRMYLGVHTPLDVSVAAVTAVVLIFVIYPIVRSAAEDPKKMAVLLGVMTVVALAYVIYANFARFPADVDPDNLFEGRKNSCSLLGALLGFCVGYTLERKYIRFETKAVWWAQVLKVLGGAALLLAVKQGLKLLFAAVGFTWIGTHAIRYFFVVLLAATVWPLTFRWFARLGRKQA